MSEFGQAFAFSRYRRKAYRALAGGQADRAAAYVPGSRFDAIKEFGADVAVAQRVAVFVGELGGLTPSCVRHGWTTIRDQLVARGRRLASYIERTASELSADEQQQASGVVRVLVRAAEALPESPLPDLVYGDALPGKYITLANGDTTAWREPEIFEWITPRRPHATGALGSVGGAVDSAWRAARWPAYIALMPVAHAVPGGAVVFWIGIAVAEAGIAVYDYLKAQPSTSTEIDELYQAHLEHEDWMYGELRGVFRQLHVTHAIAKTTADYMQRRNLLPYIDPRLGAEPPEVWDGTFPEDDGDGAEAGGEMSWLALVLVAAAGIGVLVALEA